MEVCIQEGYSSIIQCSVCKMMESVIRDHIVSYMSANNLFANEQYGFVPNRDCMTNLLSALEDWTEAIESGFDMDVIYTDFAKAFDSVPHAYRTVIPNCTL